MQSAWVTAQCSWGSGGAVSSPAASGQRPGGGAGDEAPGSSENIVFYSTGKRAFKKQG